MISSLYLSPGFFRARLEVFPGLIAGGLKLLQLHFSFILFVLQGVDGFVVFDLRIGLGIIRLGPEQGIWALHSFNCASSFSSYAFLLFFITTSMIERCAYYQAFLLPMTGNTILPTCTLPPTIGNSGKYGMYLK